MRLYLDKSVVAYADPQMNNEAVRSAFSGFTFKSCSLTVSEGKENTFIIGNPTLPTLSPKSEFAITVSGDGIAVVGKDYPSLMRGYLTLLMKIEWEMGKRELYISYFSGESVYKIENRMVHLCVFPETDKLWLKRVIRLLGALQFTHVVLELWGSVKLSSFPYCAWENAYTKEDAREIVKEIKLYGMEAIPMINSLGHASFSRSMSGKHTVLDQNSSLYYLFTPDGWGWDLENQEVWEILRNMRMELYDIFEGCRYFHLGFDESHSHVRSEELFKRLPHYMSRLTKEVCGEGKIPMIWMDLLLPKEAYVNFQPNAHSVRTPQECKGIIKELSPNTVLIDWEYGINKAPISTLTYLKDEGHPIMGAPWLSIENNIAHIDTVEENKLFGIMVTTWHTLQEQIHNLLPIAEYMGSSLSPWSKTSSYQIEAAALLRKLTYEKLDYLDTGWRKTQI